MAIALDVGASGFQYGSTTSTTLDISTFSSSAAGIIVAIIYANANVSSVTVTAGTALTFSQRSHFTTSGGTNRLATYYAVSAGAWSGTIRLTVGSSVFLSMTLINITGADTSTIWDANDPGAAVVSGPGISLTTTCSLTPASSNPFVIGNCALSAASGTQGASWTPLHVSSNFNVTQYAIGPSPPSCGATGVSTTGSIMNAIMEASAGPTVTLMGAISL